MGISSNIAFNVIKLHCADAITHTQTDVCILSAATFSFEYEDKVV